MPQYYPRSRLQTIPSRLRLKVNLTFPRNVLVKQTFEQSPHYFNWLVLFQSVKAVSLLKLPDSFKTPAPKCFAFSTTMVSGDLYVSNLPRSLRFIPAVLQHVMPLAQVLGTIVLEVAFPAFMWTSASHISKTSQDVRTKISAWCSSEKKFGPD